VLVLDGLDEVGAPEHRAAMRDLVAAFSAAHSKVPMLITSRIAGYDEASLSGKVVEVKNRPHLVYVAFHHFVLERFDDQDLRTFVTHWYSVQEPTDPVARDRGIADLLAALNADERVRELARTPILATLIAMIHRVEANLPGERAKLYELCVRMLLETWPAQAKRPFLEIDPGLQRAYLESLALDMQTTRTKNEAVTITRDDLVARLLTILRKRDFASEPEEKVARAVERWIDHLEKHSGILVEQSTGVYAFFHLSIMEYLAARGMEREFGRDGAVATIAAHFNDAVWREVCLLAVGSHAEDGDFLDAVYECVRKFAVIERWDFLLRCLREEARFRPEQRETILGQYAARLHNDGFRFGDHTLIDQIQRFSIRHGEAVKRWIEQRLDNASGDELAAAAAMAMAHDPKAGSDRLTNRRDRPAAAGALLELWPGSELGDWAAREVDATEALSWSGRAPHNLAVLRGMAALSQTTKPLVAASLIVLNARTFQSCEEGAENLALVAKLPRPGGHGLPAHIKVEPGHATLATAPRSPKNPGTRSAGASPRFAGNLVRNFASDFARDFTHDFAPAFDGIFDQECATFLDRYFAVDFPHRFARDFVYDFARDFAAWNFPHYFYRGVECALDALEFESDNFVRFTDSASVPDRSLFRIDEEEARLAARNLLAAMAGEAWIAFTTMAKSESGEERSGYFLLRIQNLWLHKVWSAIDRHLPENPSPAHLALYFALGWAQSTTTWAWPDSERWRTLFAAGPGEHWLVRSQWHLCKLTDDPASKDDDAGLRAALRDGHRDESLPGYAARLSEVLGIEG
jgi:hypothetical protein